MSQPVLTPQQNIPPLDNNGLVVNAWFLYFVAISQAIGQFIQNFAALAKTIATLVIGFANLSHVGKLTMVVAVGTIGESAVTDNGTAVTIAGRTFGAGVSSPAYAVDVSGDTNTSGVFRVAGTQVVQARLAAVSAPAITTTNTSSTAGATYTATEQGMLNTYKTAVADLNTDVVNLQGAVNLLIARLQTHGLTS